jgi:hypothetical protein
VWVDLIDRGAIAALVIESVDTWSRMKHGDGTIDARRQRRLGEG